MTGRKEQESLKGLIASVANAGSGDKVTVFDIVHEIGDDAFPPLLLVPALILVSPASGVPGMSVINGLLMALISVQMVLRRRHLWLPQFLGRRTISKKRLQRAMSYLERPAAFGDRLTRKRLSLLVSKPLDIVPALICVLAALAVPFLELIPFSSSVVAAGIAFFALALLTKDGLLILVGFGFVAGAGYLAWSMTGA